MSSKVYRLPVTNSAIASWTKVEGVKSIFWPGLILLLAISCAEYSMQDMARHGHTSLLLSIGSFVVFIINLLLSAGLIHMGISRAKGEPIQWSTLYYAFHPSVIFHLIGLIILQTLIFLAPSLIICLSMYLLTMKHLYWKIIGVSLVVLATLFFIKIIVRMTLSVGFVLDKNENPFSAIKHSIMVTRGNFWRLLGFFYMGFTILLASALMFLVGLIWTIPFWYIFYGTAYLELSKNNQG